MPILWRYLWRSYFQVFSLCVSGFIAVLLVTRFQEIARFATSGASFPTVGLFALYQIPYVLPIAIPISCLIASLLLFQRLSHSHELTALRSTGIGLYPLIFPILFAGAILSLVNFSIVSELAPWCRSLSRALIYETTSKNPLFMLQKETLVRLRNAYVDMRSLKSGQSAEDVVLVMNNSSSKRLSLLTAKELFLKGDMLIGKHVSLISCVDPKREASFDHLVIENEQSMSTKASNLAQFVQKYENSTHYDYATARMLLAREKVDGRSSMFPLTRAQAELARRISLGLSAFAFTWIGVGFGVEIGRQKKSGGSFGLLLLLQLSSSLLFQHAPFAMLL